VIAVVGITDEVDRAAGLGEEGQPNNSTVDLCPDPCFGECLRKSVLAFLLTPTPNPHPQPLSPLRNLLRLADLVLTTDTAERLRLPQEGRIAVDGYCGRL
jgi:hypothetical protein